MNYQDESSLTLLVYRDQIKPGTYQLV